MARPEFWPAAWSVRQELSSAPSRSSGPELVARLRDDWNLEWYSFQQPDLIRPEWLDVLVNNGLYDSPPQVERGEGTIRARGWPALSYLALRAADRNELVGQVLDRIDSDNWWVIADCLDIAARLDQPTAELQILRFLDQWQKCPASWIRSEALLGALSRLKEGKDPSSSIRVAVFRIACRVLTDRELEYEYEERISPYLVDVGAHLCPAVLDGIEAALAVARASSDPPWARRRPTLGNDGEELLLRTWVEIVDLERVDESLVRSARLLEADALQRRLLGIRALEHVLAEEPKMSGAAELLGECAAGLQEGPIDAANHGAVGLVAQHFGCLDGGMQRGLLASLRTRGESEELRDRYWTRDLLHALEDNLGPDDRALLAALEEELGQVRSGEVWVDGIAGIAQARSALEPSELLQMTALEIRGAIAHPPVGVGGSFFDDAASLEGFGVAMRTCIQQRFVELLPALDQLASAVGDATVAHALASGAREALREDRTLDGGQAEMMRFLEALRARVESGLDGRPAPYGVESLTRALSDLVDTAADWLFSARSEIGGRLLAFLGWLLASPDPSENYESQYGGENMDPPTLALNSTRGGCLLVVLGLLSRYWGDDGEADDDFASGLQKLIVATCASEASPSVRSGFGRYLSQLIVHWPAFFESHMDDLLPVAPDASRNWEAVFATHLRFQRPFRLAARRLEPHFGLAVERVQDSRFPYLTAGSERLLTHLLVLSMPRADDAGDWRMQLLRALDNCPEEAVSRALDDLSHAVRVESFDALEVPKSWFEGLVADRMQSGPAAGNRRGEASSLMRLALTVRLPLSQSVGLLLGLLELGASPRGQELVEYLSDQVSDAPQSAAAIFRSAIDHGLFDRASFYPEESMLELIGELATSRPDAAWGLVNQLGSLGVFAVEDIALGLAAESDRGSEVPDS
jgi:hypothetical protein